MTESRFSLINEPWIPIADIGRASLKQLFTNPSYRALGGNPVQKIALTKLLLAIAQAAYTPEDEEDWAALGAAGMAEKCMAYLEQWRDRFDLYGDQPFLQMPAIKAASVQSYGAVFAEVSTGNTTVLTQSQMEKPLTDAEKAMLIVVLMGFGLGGKKTDNSVVLSAGYPRKTNDKGKPATGKPGSSLGFMGLMHNFLLGDNLWQTLWLNLFSLDQIKSLPYANGLGIAPWQNMPEGESCEAAKNLQNSLMGRLLPLSRFCLLGETGLHYSEGITHLGYKEGLVDPSVSADFSGKDPKALWVDPERRPWRFLTALLSFLNKQNYDCYQLRLGLGRANRHADTFGIWSGGLRVSSNAGEQYVSGSDDFVESVLMLPQTVLGELWFSHLQTEMTELEQLSKIIYSATLNYFKSQNADGKKQAALAGNLYWQLCEREFQTLVNACVDFNQAQALRKTFAQFAQTAYDSVCPHDTARQLTAWAQNMPNFGKYLKDTNQPEQATA
ncbi:type I-E CRISPR-associated protein Cse1/CasA [Methylosoma difficile]